MIFSKIDLHYSSMQNICSFVGSVFRASSVTGSSGKSIRLLVSRRSHIELRVFAAVEQWWGFYSIFLSFFYFGCEVECHRLTSPLSKPFTYDNEVIPRSGWCLCAGVGGRFWWTAWHPFLFYFLLILHSCCLYIKIEWRSSNHVFSRMVHLKTSVPTVAVKTR